MTWTAVLGLLAFVALAMWAFRLAGRPYSLDDPYKDIGVVSVSKGVVSKGKSNDEEEAVNFDMKKDINVNEGISRV